MSRYYLNNKEEIIMDKNPIGLGGEGEIYEIIKPANRQSKVFKLFNLKYRAEKEPKIKDMVADVSKLIIQQLQNASLVWPEEIVYENSSFCGYIMQKANGILLESLCENELGYYPQPRHEVRLSKEWSHFDRKTKSSMQHRLKLCSTIATVLKLLHASDKYVIGDIKPSNIIVNSCDSISIIDLDSCQIADDKGKIIYESKMNTPEYSPPLDRGLQKGKEWDLFIMAIIFYKILCGVHPFGNFVCNYPYNKLILPEKIMEAGLFPFGAKANFCGDVMKWHFPFKDLSDDLQQLFILCFGDGLFEPTRRPTADDWINCLTPLPNIKYFDPERQFILSSQGVDLCWETANANSVEIDNGIGVMPVTGRTLIKPQYSTKYILKAIGLFGEASKITYVDVYPFPKIESIKVPMPDFRSNLHVDIPEIELPHINYSTGLSGIKDLDLKHFSFDSPFIKQKSKPLYEMGDDFWTISKIFEMVKTKINDLKIDI
ncbi:MAG TPA: hypothetical protein VK483_10715 [Chitinophagaceae bacterium]|nr:hypothetical protein [Chitinophagaceae bacterium]